MHKALLRTIRAMCAMTVRQTAVLATALAVLTACGSQSAPRPSATPGEIEWPEQPKLPTAPTPAQPTSLPNPSTPAGERQLITVAFNDIQSYWESSFAEAGVRYTPARLVLFTSSVGTGCGVQTSDVGPFYCAGDDTVYLDLRFFAAVEAQLGVTGDFAQAYVVAHEMGHHIQNLTGVTNRVAIADQQHPSLTNGLSVRVELQADCLAGVWAHSTYERNLLEPGDLSEALNAAAAVGDDMLQQLGTGEIEPERWTHGSSAQRRQWLATGFDSGSPAACDTFSGAI